MSTRITRGLMTSDVRFLQIPKRGKHGKKRTMGSQTVNCLCWEPRREYAENAPLADQMWRLVSREQGANVE